MAKVAEKPLQFMGSRVEAVRIHGGEPFESAYVLVMTPRSYVHIYPEKTKLIHFRKSPMLSPADTVEFDSSGNLLRLKLPDGLLKGYDVLAESRDGPYKVREYGNQSWALPEALKAQIGRADDLRVRSEIEKAWDHYTSKNEAGKSVIALRSCPQVSKELAKLPFYSAGTPLILE